MSHYSLHDASADEKNENSVQQCMAHRRNHVDMDRINEKISTSTPVSAIKTTMIVTFKKELGPISFL